MLVRILFFVSLVFIESAFAQDHQKFSTAKIGIIEIYGSKIVSNDQVASLLRRTDSITSTQLENEIKKNKDVKHVSVTSVCCELGKRILYVGITEGPEVMKWRSTKGRSYRLDDVLIAKHKEFLAALRDAVIKGDNLEDFTDGHSFFTNPTLRSMQIQFKDLANQHFKSLKLVLLHSALPAQRKIAADLIAYARNKQDIINVLSKAIKDPDPGVRNNVIRAFAPLSAYQLQNPQQKLRIDHQLFPKLLNSIYWSDRDKAMFALVAITESRDPHLLNSLSASSIGALIEMAQWKSEGHAMLAYLILGRLMRLPDEDIFSTWSQTNRHFLIEKAKSFLSEKS